MKSNTPPFLQQSMAEFVAKVAKAEDDLIAEKLEKHLGRPVIPDEDFKYCNMVFDQGTTNDYTLMFKNNRIGIVRRYFDTADPINFTFNITFEA